MTRTLRLLTAALATFTVVLATAPATPAASEVACKRVRNPYPGTRYEGIGLTRIRAERVSCSTARRVARRAHRKALGMTPPPSGIRQFTWHGWQVTGDLRPASDRYLARKDERRVRWRF